MRPDRDLTLDLTVREAEILISANEEVRNFADQGGLKELHNKYNALTGKVEIEYFNVREQLAKTLLLIEGKESEINEQLANEFGLKVRRHGESAPILDTLGLTSGDAAIDNLNVLEGAIERGHENAEQLSQIRGWLHISIGLKAKIFAIETELKEQYLNLVAKEQDDKAVVEDELRLLAAARDSY